MSGARLSAVDPLGGQNAARRTRLGRVTLACAVALLAAALLSSACGEQTASLAAVLPGADAFPGWMPDGEAQLFDRDTVFQLVDGQADVFFAYGFQQVAVRRYENRQDVQVDIHVWQLRRPADAYGLFSADTTGAPADVGNDGDLESGRRLAFWQDRYTVWVHARPQADDAELWRFAEALSEALPKGGEPPALMAQLPAEGMVERSAVCFHQEISIQDRLWLGGENLLGLGPETDGALAQYETDGGIALLLLVQYPSAQAAAAGRTALADSRIEGLIATDAHGGLLGAVLGEVDAAAAANLLVSALGNRW
jgi:hypothetical protein